MILVTVGTHNMSFSRLLKALDRIVESGKIIPELEAQIGYSDYLPRNYPYRRFFPAAEFGEKLQAAEMVVTHAGGGIISTCLREGKKMVVVPRLKKFREHTNDHQMELAREVEEKGWAQVVYDMVNLAVALEEVLRREAPPARPRQDYHTRFLIERFLDEMVKR